MTKTSTIIGAMRERSLLIVGDVMLDQYISGDADRISPEAPVPIIRRRDVSHSIGGAANAARNAAALGGEIALVGVVGEDDAGDKVRKLLAQERIEDGLIAVSDRPTTTKTRLLAAGQQIARIDAEDTRPLNEESADQIIAGIERLARGRDGILVSDYMKGVISRRVVDTLVRRAWADALPLVVDPIGHDSRRYEGATVLTPNVAEARTMAGNPTGSIEDVADTILNELPGTSVLVTRGAEGASLFAPPHPPLHIPVPPRQVFDVTGAGDTVAATLALALAAGIKLDTAAQVATAAGSVVVGKVGTTVVHTEELAEVLGGTVGLDPT